jgi:hypothetical protein
VLEGLGRWHGQVEHGVVGYVAREPVGPGEADYVTGIKVSDWDGPTPPDEARAGAVARNNTVVSGGAARLVAAATISVGVLMDVCRLVPECCG